MTQTIVTTKDSRKYKTIVTDIGQAKIAAAVLNGEKVSVTTAVVGDGGGVYVLPVPEMTELVNEVWRGEIASAAINPKSKNMIDVRIFLDGTIGGFTVREIGVLDEEGDLIAVCNLPDTDKAVIAEGIAASLTLVMHIVFTNVEALDFKIDPSIDTVGADEVHSMIQVHNEDPEAHSDLRQAVSNLERKLGGGVIRAERLDITIPANGWEDDEDTAGVFQFHIDIVNPDITEDMVPQLTILPQSMETAGACGLCQTAKTLHGALRVYGNTVPDTPINASLILLGDFRKNGELTIPAVGWQEDPNGLYIIDLPDEDITADLTPMLTILPESLQTAGDCGISTAAQTLDGFLRIYARTTPSTAIKANLALLGTAQSGGVKVRSDSGLTLDNKGYLSLNSATRQEVAGLFNGSKADFGQE